MTPTNELYKANERLIWNRVHSIAATHRRDPDDLIGRAHEIFCEACKRYDEEKGASFSTYLYHALADLSTEARKTSEESNYYELSSFSEYLSEKEFFFDKVELFSSIEADLSEDAQQFLKDLFAGVFARELPEQGGRHWYQRFPRTDVKTEYQWSRHKIEKVRQEITVWWRNY